MPEHVDAESRHARDRVGEIGAVLLGEPGERLPGHDLLQRVAHLFLPERRVAQRLQFAVQPDARRIARHEVQVRTALDQYVAQELVDASWRVLLGRLVGDDLAAPVLIRPAPA